MVGHHGRLIILDDGSFTQNDEPDTSVDDLIREAGQMVSLLGSLKGVLR